MSIASPTLRSSSSTVPGPILRSSPTSMWARPSTAETCTGTSNTASRSAALCALGSAEGVAIGSASRATTSSPVRLGNGTWSLSAMFISPERSRHHRHAPRIDVAADRIGDRNLGLGAVALEAAVGPFDPAVAEGDVALCHHDQPALETARAGDLLEPVLGLAIERPVDAYDQVGGRQELAEALVGERRDLGEGLARDQVAGELAADRDRDLDRLRLEPVLDGLEARAHLLERVRDALEGAGDPPLDLGARLRLGCVDAATIAAHLRLGDRRLVVGRRDRRRGLLGGRAEIVVEQESAHYGHSSPRVLNRPALRRRGSSRS